MCLDFPLESQGFFYIPTMSHQSLPGLPDLQTGTIYCIGRNYAEHARELQNEIPAEPVVFLKPSGSIIYDGGTIRLPEQSNNVHHEVEMVVAIGKKGNKIPKEEAFGFVAGYAVGIDVTARDIQQKAKEKSHPWAVAKGFDTFAPLSRFIAADAVRDPQNLELKLSVNGEIRQNDNTSLMIFPVPALISYLSGIFTLYPGDIIFTGTPKGVASLKKSDQVKATLGDSAAELSLQVS